MKTGIVIPCYNEANRLDYNAFRSFLTFNTDYHLCFVNDGSKDDTLTFLKRMRKGFETQITIVDCKTNGGKAEAVRQGVLTMYQSQNIDYIGFLDADLSVSLEEFTDLVQTIHTDPTLKIVSGSRVKRMGAVINRNLKRHLSADEQARLVELGYRPKCQLPNGAFEYLTQIFPLPNHRNDLVSMTQYEQKCGFSKGEMVGLFSEEQRLQLKKLGYRSGQRLPWRVILYLKSLGFY